MFWGFRQIYLCRFETATWSASTTWTGGNSKFSSPLLFPKSKIGLSNPLRNHQLSPVLPRYVREKIRDYYNDVVSRANFLPSSNSWPSSSDKHGGSRVPSGCQQTHVAGRPRGHPGDDAGLRWRSFCKPGDDGQQVMMMKICICWQFLCSRILAGVEGLSFSTRWQTDPFHFRTFSLSLEISISHRHTRHSIILKVIDMGGEAISSNEYLGVGKVTEFRCLTFKSLSLSRSQSS